MRRIGLGSRQEGQFGGGSLGVCGVAVDCGDTRGHTGTHGDRGLRLETPPSAGQQKAFPFPREQTTGREEPQTLDLIKESAVPNASVCWGRARAGAPVLGCFLPEMCFVGSVLAASASEKTGRLGGGCRWVRAPTPSVHHGAETPLPDPRRLGSLCSLPPSPSLIL